MTDEELRQRLFEVVRPYLDAPVEQRLHRELSAREVAEGMDLPEAEVERLAEAGAIPGYKDADGSWSFSVDAFMLFLQEPLRPEDLAWMREALAAGPISERARRRWSVEDIVRIWNASPDEVRRLAEQGILTGHCDTDGTWTFSYRDVMDYAARREREA